MSGPADPRPRVGGALARLIARPDLQAWAARFPLTRRLVRREGDALFDLVAGFCHSQILMALVALEVPRHLLPGPLPLSDLSRRCAVPEARMAVLVRGAAALGLLRMRRGGRVALSRRGAALAGVPGLAGMIRHHAVLYGDLADPAAFFRGETDPALARFWPYVFGAAQADRPEIAERYSTLMTQTQELVAADTLAAVSLAGVRHLMDVGGGTGAFLAATARRWPDLRLTLVDLPAVVAAVDPGARRWGGKLTVAPLSFRDAPLPQGADAISLVRVLYDHDDATVAQILRAAQAALPPGGRLIVSEPVLGSRAGDAYFALYTLAMETGRTRTGDEIAALCRAAGFRDIRVLRSHRPFVTTVLTAQRTY